MRIWSCIYVVSVIVMILTSRTVTAQSSSFQLKTADSLYNAGRFTQSYEHYSEILARKEFTPGMLLRMAYIQEGLGNVGTAMYHLNLYFLATNDPAVTEKMEQLAAKFNLVGYEADDSERFLIFYHDQYRYITIGLAAIIVLMLSLMFYTRMRLHIRPVVSGIFFIVFVVALAVHINLGQRVDRGILISQTNYIMEGPSSGAPVVAITTGGHRVEVVGKRDVWLKIVLDGRTAFVRDRTLLPIEL